jgi:hypothetical protein
VVRLVATDATVLLRALVAVLVAEVVALVILDVDPVPALMVPNIDVVSYWLFRKEF